MELRQGPRALPPVLCELVFLHVVLELLQLVETPLLQRVLGIGNAVESIRCPKNDYALTVTSQGCDASEGPTNCSTASTAILSSTRCATFETR